MHRSLSLTSDAPYTASSSEAKIASPSTVAPGLRVSAVSSSSTVSSLKDWPAADCATRQLFFRLISLFAAFTRRTLKAWVRKCLSPTDTLPLSPWRAKTITASGAAAKPREGAASRPARVRAIAFFILISFGKD